MIICGIDPGAGGALAFIDGTGRLVAVDDMPTTREARRGRSKTGKALKPLARVDPAGVHDILLARRPHLVWIEKVGTRRHDGKRQAFSFGSADASARAAVRILRIELQSVEPAVWKHAMGLNASKEWSCRIACSLFPDFADLFPVVGEKGHNRAEAACIALYGLGQARMRGLVDIALGGTA